VAKITIIGKSGPLIGEIITPGDKSISHRAVILSSLAVGTSTINGFLKSEDTLSTLNAFINMGVEIHMTPEILEINGVGIHGLKKPFKTVDAGNSGTTARLLMGLLSGQEFISGLTGDKYLRKRPMRRVVDPLKLMGADITGENNADNLPLIINGRKLKSIKYRLPVASAQVKSAIILAGLFADGETEIIEPQKTRDHTERMLNHLGSRLRTDDKSIFVSPVEKLNPSNLNIPSDISSAAFFIVAALINKGSEIILKNVGLNTARTGILEILKRMGGSIEIQDKKIECGEDIGDLVVKSSNLKGIEINGEDIPRAIDELPIIAAAACFAEGRTVITDAKELRVKETDRIKAVVSEFSKLGADITELEDGMIINGSQQLKGNICDSWGDHRIAMSLAIAATLSSGETTINNSECVNISYPEFFDTLSVLRT
jgi:3-phosphoshikimate 1-carboxyvinyltransferase